MGFFTLSGFFPQIQDCSLFVFGLEDWNRGVHFSGSYSKHPFQKNRRRNEFMFIYYCVEYYDMKF
jgi:hypothetical protein